MNARVSPDVLDLRNTFEQQKSKARGGENPDRKQRLDRLDQLARLIEQNREAFVDAIAADFGARSREETLIVDINACLGTITYLRKNLRKWMRPRRRHTSIWFLPGSNYTLAQPLGVVGVIAPWNYPLHLSLGPAATALAAGNSVMIKMSEAVPQTAALLHRLIRENFDPSVLSVTLGDAAFSEEFASLPFDHLFFTGSTQVGRKVMALAAPNLTPVTLELGGKSPAIVDQNYPLHEAARRISWGKLFNAGQTCVAPDYVIVPAGKERAFAQTVLDSAKSMRGAAGAPPRHTQIVNDIHFTRLQRLVEDAHSGGAEVLRESDVIVDRHMPLTLVINPPAESPLMQQEIFGPVLPIIGAPSITDKLLELRNGPAPLALYYFSKSSSHRKKALGITRSGGVTFNDVLLHYLQDDLPFGGLGASGMGRSHGKEGFDTFSHHRPVFTQRGFGTFTGTKLLYPPYGRLARTLIKTMRRI